MIQDICTGVAVMFALLGLFSTGVPSRLAWAAVFVTFTVSFAALGGSDYGWAGGCAAVAIHKAATAVNDWAKGRRMRRSVR